MPRRICPGCGSKDTVYIFRSKSKYPEMLQEKLEKKEIVLGGCSSSKIDPTHRCNECNKDFGANHYLSGKVIKELFFYVGGYFGTSHWVYINTEKSDQMIKYAVTEGPGIDIKTEEYLGNAEILRVPVCERWIEFNKDILHCYIMDWNSYYDDNDILDGTQWTMEIVFEDGTEIDCGGSNAYPPHWNKLIKVFRKHGLPRIS